VKIISSRNRWKLFVIAAMLAAGAPGAARADSTREYEPAKPALAPAAAATLDTAQKKVDSGGLSRRHPDLDRDHPEGPEQRRCAQPDGVQPA
jgi:hypothetical protein